MREILVMASAYARPRVQTVGVEVGRQDGLWGRESWREIARQRPAFSWGEIILVTSNGIKSRKEHERRGDEI